MLEKYLRKTKGGEGEEPIPLPCIDRTEECVEVRSRPKDAKKIILAVSSTVHD